MKRLIPGIRGRGWNRSGDAFYNQRAALWGNRFLSKQRKRSGTVSFRW